MLNLKTAFMKNKKSSKLKIFSPRRLLMVNRIIMAILFLGFINMTVASNYAQKTKLSLSFNNISLKKVFKEIEKQSEFYFMYNNSTIDIKKKVSLHVKEQTIYQILDEVLEGAGIDYDIVNKQIVLTPEAKEKVQDNIIRSIQVGGTVSDESGTTLPGVSVVEKGTQNGTITDLNGQFSINVENAESILLFSFIGYESQEILVGNATDLKITLKEQVTDLDEVVVIGYGVSSKKLLTGSIGNVDAAEIQETATYSLEGALQGKTSGLQIIQNSGTPGSAMAVKIRGTATIFGGSQPLYVIDGVPMTTGDFSQIGYGGQGVDASIDINPSDIESVSVLKDASAAAIYGARATNGVILITTKNGSKGKSKISYRSYFGVQKEWKRLDLMNATQWKSYVNTFDPSFVSSLEPTISTDWQEEVFRVASMMNHELSFTGGTDKTLFYLSGGYLNQEGIILGTGYKKYSVRSNIDHKLTDRLSLTFKNGLTYSINDRVRGDQEIDGVLPNAISMPPIYPVYDELGNYSETGSFKNPVATGNESTTRANTLRNISSFELTYRLIEGLTLKNQWGADFYNMHERRIEPLTTRTGQEKNGMIIEARSNVSKISQQLLATYDKSFGNHNLQLLAGYSFEIFKDRFSYTHGENFPQVYPEYITSAGNIVEAYTGANDEGINSFFGRVKYNFSDKYLFEVSLRADGSSKFGTNNRYAFLPAGSFAWRVIEESFMKDQTLISDLKIKVGYGLTGNDQIGSNRYQNLYTTGRNYYSLPGLAPLQIPNPDLKWETTKSFNAGLDIEFFKGRLGLSAEYYNNLTTDLLLPRPLPGSSGFNSFTTNVGSIENKGYEFTLNTVNFEGDFSWTSSFNISFNKNKVLELYNDQPIIFDEGDSRASNSIIVGEPIGVFFIYESQGVDPSTGDLVLTDIDGDDVPDRMVVGNPNPVFTGGFTNIMSYKGFDLRIFMQYSYGNDIYNGTRRYLENNSYGKTDNQLVTVLNQWMQPGDITKIPRFKGIYNDRQSTRYMEDGSYLRLKEITLGYHFSQKALDKMKFISSLRLYLKGQNLLTFTNYSGLDPEVNYAGGTRGEFALGTDFFTFPIPRVLLFGINIDF
jgi:TonB-linked SusC/RagA family outer membrane protein